MIELPLKRITCAAAAAMGTDSKGRRAEMGRPAQRLLPRLERGDGGLGPVWWQWTC